MFSWHKGFKGGRELRTNSAQGVLQLQELRTLARVKAVLGRDRRLNVRLIAEKVGLPKTDFHQIRCETADKWFLHHDIAPSHTSFSEREFFKQNYITTLSHPPYSPDLAPCDFFLFPKLKTHLK